VWVEVRRVHKLIAELEEAGVGWVYVWLYHKLKKEGKVKEDDDMVVMYDDDYTIIIYGTGPTIVEESKGEVCAFTVWLGNLVRLGCRKKGET
jgi:hypothetical protein